LCTLSFEFQLLVRDETSHVASPNIGEAIVSYVSTSICSSQSTCLSLHQPTSCPGCETYKDDNAMQEISGDSVWMMRIGSSVLTASAEVGSDALASQTKTLPIMVPTAINRARCPGTSAGEDGVPDLYKESQRLSHQKASTPLSNVCSVCLPRDLAQSIETDHNPGRSWMPIEGTLGRQRETLVQEVSKATRIVARSFWHPSVFIEASFEHENSFSSLVAIIPCKVDLE
ncbi:hypothetical protein KCU93_g141, partial [Aureobasidium melanogenum]